VLKRFIAEDPIGMMGGANFYLYVGGNPINFRDPSGRDPTAGIELGRRMLCESGGDPDKAWQRALDERIGRNWEALSVEGKRLREAENYLWANKFVSEGANNWYGSLGAWTANAFMTPAWQATRAVENVMRQNLNSPASTDAMRAGYQGAYDALGGKR
jgi:hypothetical protein